MNFKKIFTALALKSYNISTSHISPKIADNVEAVISPTRLSTYKKISNKPNSALNLYLWNANVSGAFLFPLHICEIAVRNAVSNALVNVYGDKWPWNDTFKQSLPDRKHGYSPRADLENAVSKMKTTGKVIPELKFVFWQNMFTKRHDTRIWNKNLLQVMANLDHTKSTSVLREEIYNSLEHIRLFRNRIAHHEPIINRQLAADYKQIIKIIKFINLEAAKWVEDNQTVTTCLKNRPK